jgi:hypothetical protein
LLASFLKGFDVGDRAFEKGNLVANFSEVFFLACGKIVEDYDAVTTANEFFHGV